MRKGEKQILTLSPPDIFDLGIILFQSLQTMQDALKTGVTLSNRILSLFCKCYSKFITFYFSKMLFVCQSILSSKAFAKDTASIMRKISQIPLNDIMSPLQ